MGMTLRVPTIGTPGAAQLEAHDDGDWKVYRSPVPSGFDKERDRLGNLRFLPKHVILFGHGT